LRKGGYQQTPQRTSGSKTYKKPLTCVIDIFSPLTLYFKVTRYFIESIFPSDGKPMSLCVCRYVNHLPIAETMDVKTSISFVDFTLNYYYLKQTALFLTVMAAPKIRK